MNWPVNPLRGNQTKPLTGEPCAGNPPARFGGGRGRNQSVLPTPINGKWRCVAREHSVTAAGPFRFRTGFPVRRSRQATVIGHQHLFVRRRVRKSPRRRQASRRTGIRCTTQSGHRTARSSPWSSAPDDRAARPKARGGALARRADDASRKKRAAAQAGLPVADGPKTTLRPTVPIRALFGTYSKSARISPQKPPSPSRYPSRNQGSETRQKP